MTNSTQEEIDALKAFHGVETDAALADALGVAKNTISTWKARGILPERFRSQLDVHSVMRGDMPDAEDQIKVAHAFDALTKLNNLERQALKVALVRFVHEHPGFGVSVPESIKIAAGVPETLAAFAHRAYRDLLNLRKDDHLPFSDAAALLIVQHLSVAASSVTDGRE